MSPETEKFFNNHFTIFWEEREKCKLIKKQWLSSAMPTHQWVGEWYSRTDKQDGNFKYVKLYPRVAETSVFQLKNVSVAPIAG